jgi:rare lipoprotein A
MSRTLLVSIAFLLASGCATTTAASSSTKLASAKAHHAKKSKSSAKPLTAKDGDGSEWDGPYDNDGPDDGEGERDVQQDLAAIVSEGAASYYHDALAGRITANGEKYDPDDTTCAHRSLPFGTVLVIEDVATGKKSHCRVNDRGPFVDGRVIDVSRKVARDLGMIDRGVIRVRIRVAKQPTSS